MNIICIYGFPEESIIRVREEEERRKEVSTKFQSTLAEVSMLLQQNNDKNQKLREENSEMATKLQMLCDQYSLREQHLDKLGKQYDIERQLNEAKLAKIRMDSAEVKEKMLREKQLLLLVLRLNIYSVKDINIIDIYYRSLQNIRKSVKQCKKKT